MGVILRDYAVFCFVFLLSPTDYQGPFFFVEGFYIIRVIYNNTISKIK